MCLEKQSAQEIFWPEKDEVSEKISLLHNEELCGLGRLPSIVKFL
jgi:hypothetical protein